jgi:signal transduction histidine kinase
MTPLIFDLDIQTAFRFFGFVWIFMSFILWTVARGTDRLPPRLWVLGSVAVGMGLTLLSFRPQVPVVLGFHAAQTLLSGGLLVIIIALIGEGSATGRPGRGPVMTLSGLFLIYIVGFYLQVSLGTDQTFRFIYVAVSQSLLAVGYVAGVIWVYLRFRGTGSAVLLASGLAFVIMAMGRAQGIFLGFEDTGLYSATFENALVFYAGLLATVMGPIGMSLLQADRVLSQAARVGSASSFPEGSSPREGPIQSLQRIIEERNDLLVAAERSARLNTVGMYSAAIAHELRQPLTVMGLDAGFLERQMEQEGIRSPELLDAVRNVRAQQERAASIISALRDLYMIEPDARRTVSLSDTVGHTVGMIRTLPEARGIEIHESGLDSNLSLTGHPVQLQQIFFNLLTNALVATGQTGHSEVRVRVYSDGAFGVVDIEDSGPGLPPRLFESSGIPLTNGERQGMGLGLTIARTIVERHEGTLTGTSLPDGGARIQVRLPLTPHTSER